MTGPAVVPATTRGATWVADRVVRKIAQRAADEIVAGTPPATAEAASSLPALRVAGGRCERVDVDARGGQARVRLELTLGYPGAAVEVTRAVRSHVRASLRRLAGIESACVDVAVTRLVSPASRARRVR